MDWDTYRQFLLVDLDHAEATVDQRLRWARHMAKTGFSWDNFAKGPQQALAEGRKWLAWKKVNGGKSCLHNYQLVLNDAARYFGDANKEFAVVKFAHTKPGYGHPEPYSPHELELLLGYRNEDAFVEKRRRAMIWLCLNTGLRRSEIWRIQTTDFRTQERELVVRPAKRGKPRAIPLPHDAWSPKRPLMAYLRAREEMMPQHGPLWISRDGKPLTLNLMGRENFDIGNAIGVTVSFNRARRTRATHLARSGVDLGNLQALYGHSSPASTKHYYDVTTADMRASLARAKIPGFIRHRSAKPEPGFVSDVVDDAFPTV